MRNQIWWYLRLDSAVPRVRMVAVQAGKYTKTRYRCEPAWQEFAGLTVPSDMASVRDEA